MLAKVCVKKTQVEVLFTGVCLLARVNVMFRANVFVSRKVGANLPFILRWHSILSRMG